MSDLPLRAILDSWQRGGIARFPAEETFGK
jgi:hypothetical protein